MKYKIIKNITTFDNDKVDKIIVNTDLIDFEFISYGATLTSAKMADKFGNKEEILATYKNIEDYYHTGMYFGMTIGPTSGRIDQGRCIIGNKEYNFEKNWNDVCHLHGGVNSISFQNWEYEIFDNEELIEIIFSCKTINDYPGILTIINKYTIHNNGRLVLTQEADTDKLTLCNLTNHAYFNLSGDYKKSIAEQHLTIAADNYLDLNENLIAQEIINVHDTPYDFTKEKMIGADMKQAQIHNKTAYGYDHPWLLNDIKDQIIMIDYESGRKLSITTDYPCVVCYTYNYPSDVIFPNGTMDYYNAAITFECQYEPNGINNPKLNSGLLHPNEHYKNSVVYNFTLN